QWQADWGGRGSRSQRAGGTDSRSAGDRVESNRLRETPARRVPGRSRGRGATPRGVQRGVADRLTGSRTPRSTTMRPVRLCLPALLLAAFLPLSVMLGVMVKPARAGLDDANAGALTFGKGTHICIVGNTLADRMQHDGWLETYLQNRFPNENLVIRNLG